jgi:predicted RNA binding protein YcfA (HicA-like mRNA interferase family)
MPKLPRIGSRECLAALEKLGFVAVRQRGSHIVMRLGARGCVVPSHREIRVGTLAGILRQAGIDPDEFIKALKG